MGLSNFYNRSGEKSRKQSDIMNVRQYITPVTLGHDSLRQNYPRQFGKGWVSLPISTCTLAMTEPWSKDVLFTLGEVYAHRTGLPHSFL